jgi:hypothetical protein
MRMFAIRAAFFGLACLVSGMANAACIIPNTLLPGTLADASQVMANFNALNACINKGNMIEIGLAGPATTANLGAETMMGFAPFTAFTPVSSGNIFIYIQAQCSSTVAHNGWSQTLRVGTGTAPVGGAAATGSQIGLQSILTAPAATDFTSCNMGGIVPGLTVGVPIWVDESWSAVTGGTASIIRISVFVFEL